MTNPRRVLLLMRAILILCIPIVGIGLLWPARSPVPPTEFALPAAPARTTMSPSKHELSWYTPLWSRNLKESPIPKVAAAQPVTPQPPTNVPILLATLVEPEGRYAHFASTSGMPRMRGLDEMIDNFKVKDIEPGRVQLQAGDKTIWVELPKPKD